MFSYKQIIATCGYAFLIIGIIISVWAVSEPRLSGDLAIIELVQSMSSDSVKSSMKIARYLGGVRVNLVVILLMFTVLTWKKFFRTGVMFLGVIPASLGIYILKELINRSRPDGDYIWIIEASSTGSFPSGHAYQTALLGVLTVALFLPIIPCKIIRIAIALFVFCLVGLVALSGIYLGVHWPSDILGSFVFVFPSAVLLIRLSENNNLKD
ncbi:MAG: undecaprenyl-diphosphatase [Chloroflexi bacterium]|jgi:undecaprenyl-diphosphatase|nr:MAG: undecaprenyl-diphosphatase [Chloroflexota bacterium]